MRDLADGFVPLPAIQLLGTPVPVGDDVIHVADENGIVREIKKRARSRMTMSAD
jgi:hypothetical protein